jgi:hypothetical protein
MTHGTVVMTGWLLAWLEIPRRRRVGRDLQATVRSLDDGRPARRSVASRARDARRIGGGMIGLPHIVALAAFAGVAGGCTATGSEGIDTRALWPRYQVVHAGDGQVAAQAMLRVDGPTGRVVDLTGGDHFVLDGVRMTELVEAVTNYVWSVAVVPEAPDASYDIVLVRDGERATTSVRTPAEPAISGTEPAAVVQAGQRLTVTWDATEPGDGVEVRVEGDCVTDLRDSNLPDTGSHTTEPLRDGAAPGDCDISVLVIRTRTRVIGAPFAGGWSEAYRHDAITLVYDPLRS